MHVRHASPAPRDPPAGPADDHPITPALRLRTCQIISARFRLENERHARMAIEIKGLKLQAMTARGHLDRMTKAYAKFNEAAPAHAADVEGMAEQVTEMQSDLEFATNLLGNSPAVSGNGDAKPQKPAVVPQNTIAAVGDRGEPKTAPATIVGQTAMPETTNGAMWFESPRTQDAGEAERLRTEFLDGKITAEERAAGEKSLWEAGQAAAATFPGNKL